MNALLVYPRYPITYWGLQSSLPLIGKRASLPPHGLLTVAALLPSHWHVRLVVPNVDALHDDDFRWADIVLTGGLLIQTKSMQETVARAIAFSLPVAVGGPAAAANPDFFGDADLVFQGEAEGRIDELVRALVQPSGSHLILEAPRPRRRLFWQLMLKAMSRVRSHIRQAIAHAVLGEHLILYTREHVVPRMERALAEIQTATEHGRRPLPSGRGAPRASTTFASPMTAGNTRLPVFRQARPHPQPILSSDAAS